MSGEKYRTNLINRPKGVKKKNHKWLMLLNDLIAQNDLSRSSDLSRTVSRIPDSMISRVKSF